VDYRDKISVNITQFSGEMANTNMPGLIRGRPKQRTFKWTISQLYFFIAWCLFMKFLLRLFI